MENNYIFFLQCTRKPKREGIQSKKNCFLTRWVQINVTKTQQVNLIKLYNTLKRQALGLKLVESDDCRACGSTFELFMNEVYSMVIFELQRVKYWVQRLSTNMIVGNNYNLCPQCTMKPKKEWI